MKRLLTVIVTILLLLPSFIPVKAGERSVHGINDDNQIDNSEESAVIKYEGKQARVFYGSTGIYIVCEDRTVHLETDFAVIKLVPAGDINADGYTDFLTWQSAPDLVDQVLCLSGKDGKVMFSRCFARPSYDPTMGDVMASSYIQQFICEGSTAYVIYDYKIEALDLQTGDTLFVYSDKNNIWKAIVIDDMDNDSVRDIAYSGQDNVIGVISGSSGESLYTVNPAENYLSHPTWSEDVDTEAVMNMWDLVYEKGHIYALSEDGYLCDIDLQSREDTKTALGIVDEESLSSFLNLNTGYVKGGIKYEQTGLASCEYFGYRFAEVTPQYFLIDCFMGDTNSLYSASGSYFPSMVALYDRKEGKVTAKIGYEAGFVAASANSCFAQYEGEQCIALLTSLSNRTGRLSVYRLDGTLINQQDFTASFIDGGVQYHLSYDENGYLLEAFKGGCLRISSDLKESSYYYDAAGADLIDIKEGRMMVLYEKNSVKNRLVVSSSDISDVIWQYETTDSIENRGFEYLKWNDDYNSDGYDDVLGIVNSYDDKGHKTASYYIILDGQTGEELLNRRYQTGYNYDERNRKTPAYLISDSFRLINDIDGDKKKELICDMMVVSSRKNDIVGYAYGSFDSKGTVLELGDINKDGFADYVDIAEKETRIYQSKAAYSGGYFTLSYTKTNTSIPNKPEYKAPETSGLLGDVDFDGVSEIVMIDFNSEGYQVFKVLNGKTLEPMYLLCKDGVIDYGESFVSLNNDLNGDGYSELWGYEHYQNAIYDGKTGEFMVSADQDVNLYDKYEGDYDWHPDYLVPFTKRNLSDKYFVVVSDLNGNYSKEIALLQYSYGRYGDLNELNVYDSVTGKLLSENTLSDSVWTYSLLQIEGDDSLMGIMDSRTGTTRIIDISRGKELAEYGLSFSRMWKLSDKVLIGKSGANIFMMDMEKSFNMTTEIPQETDEHKLHLAWKPLQNYSLMTIYDNGTAIYVGQDLEADIVLMEGDHTITLAMNDGQGKSYMESYNVTVMPQKRNIVIPVIIAIAALAATVIFGIGQKILFRRNFRRTAR